MRSNLGSDPYLAFRRRWDHRRREAAEIFMHERAAHVISVVLQELDAMRAAEVSGEVGIQEAARLSGYSVSSIWRLLNDEQVTNVGEPGRPRIRIRDLPFKPRRSVISCTPAKSPRRSDAALGSAELEIVAE